MSSIEGNIIFGHVVLDARNAKKMIHYLKEYKQTAEKLLKENKRLQSELQQERESHRWIPVEERLPEDGERVNLIDDATEFFIYGEKDTYTDDGRWLWKTDLGAWHKENVTHWQPLPSSPEKDKE